MSVSIKDLQIQLTMTVGELADVASILEGAVEALEECKEPVPPVYYQITGQYHELLMELNSAVADAYGVE
jgi:hypothetical protein